MIKALLKKPDGTRVVLAGITNGNVKKMKEGQPLQINLSELGLESIEVVIHHRATMRELEADFEKHIGSKTKIRIDPRTITDPEPDVGDDES